VVDVDCAAPVLVAEVLTENLHVPALTHNTQANRHVCRVAQCQLLRLTSASCMPLNHARRT
jgi:hypothetical protein